MVGDYNLNRFKKYNAKRKNSIVLVECSECGMLYFVKYNTWSHASKDHVYRCGKCLKRFQSEHANKINSDPEFKKRKSIEMINRWENKTSDEKQLSIEALHKALSEYNSRLTPDERTRLNLEQSKKMKELWSNKSKEEKDLVSIKMKEYWSSLPEDILLSKKDALRKIWTSYRNNMTDDEFRKYCSNRGKKYWSSMTSDEKLTLLAPLREGYMKWLMTQNAHDELSKRCSVRNQKHWNSLTDSEKAEYIKRFIGYTKKSSQHQKFESYFHDSYINNSYYYEEECLLSDNGVMHSWDYGIYDENGTLQMVVDLDGAYYHADKCDYDGLHSKEEYDDKRFLSIPDGVKYHIIYEHSFSKSFEAMIKKLMLNYDEFVEDQFRYCRLLPDLPYPFYSDKELVASYKQLIRLKTNDKYHKSISLNNREGDKLINHFHHSIYSAKRKDSKRSPYEAWYDDDLLRKIIKNRIIYINKINPNKILQGFNIAKVAMKVSVFSAGRAKLIISRYLSDLDTIFDPFSGFSGRMLGTIASGKKYIGQDISEIHLRESSQIIEFLKQHGYFPEVELHQKDINCSRGEYPCLFTCPPYADKEQWLDVPIDMRICDDWIDLCLNNFKCQRYVFVVDETNRYKDHIVDTITNKSHMNKNNEYIVMIDKNK